MTEKFLRGQAVRSQWHAREARLARPRADGSMLDVMPSLPSGSADDALAEASRLIAEVREERKREAEKRGR